MTDRELMQMALDALEWFERREPFQGMRFATDAAESLRAALAQPEQEPWGYISHKSWKMPVFVEADNLEVSGLPFNNPNYTPVYKAPPQRECCCGDSSELGVVHRADAPCFHYEQREWQGLTDEDVNEIVFVERSWADAVRKVEAKLKEKNG